MDKNRVAGSIKEIKGAAKDRAGRRHCADSARHDGCGSRRSSACGARAGCAPPVAHAYERHYAHHYAWRNGDRYAYSYGYNLGAAAVGGVIGSIMGAGVAAAYPYSCANYYYGPYNGCSD
jgi:hypothetical protein